MPTIRPNSISGPGFAFKWLGIPGSLPNRPGGTPYGNQWNSIEFLRIPAISQDAERWLQSAVSQDAERWLQSAISQDALDSAETHFFVPYTQG